MIYAPGLRQTHFSVFFTFMPPASPSSRSCPPPPPPFPTPLQRVCVTAGGDGTFTFWNVETRRIHKEYVLPCQGQLPVSAGALNEGGTVYAYAVSYDWSKGSQHIPNADNSVSGKNRLLVHTVTHEDVTTPAGAVPGGP